MKNIAVIFGGTATESEVSVITGVLIANALKEKYRVVPVFIDKDGKWHTGYNLLDIGNFSKGFPKDTKRATFISGDDMLYIIKKNKLKSLFNIDCVVNCIHGERGEDGSLSGLLDMSGVPVASPDIFSSAVAMDKQLTKTVLKGMGIKALPSICISSVEELESVNFPFEFPVIVKPARGGSSIGIKVAYNSESVKEAIEYALSYGKRAVIEPYIAEFTEINCASYSGKDGKVVVSECEQPVFSNGVLSFDDKYKTGKRIFPAKIPKSKSDKIKSITERIYRELGFTGVIRIDYMLIKNEVYLNEINSVPGSLAYYLFSKTVKGFSETLSEIIETATEEYKKQREKNKTYESGILSGLGSKG